MISRASLPDSHHLSLSRTGALDSSQKYNLGSQYKTLTTFQAVPRTACPPSAGPAVPVPVLGPQLSTEPKRGPALQRDLRPQKEKTKTKTRYAAFPLCLFMSMKQAQYNCEEPEFLSTLAGWQTISAARRKLILAVGGQIHVPHLTIPTPTHIHISSSPERVSGAMR